MNLLDLQTLIKSVDAVTPRLGQSTPLDQAYAMLGMPSTGNLNRSEITERLQTEIRAAFSCGHSKVFYHCRELRKQLVHEHITNDTPLDPYFEILSRLMDAMQRGDTGNAVQGDWDVALSATAELRAFAGDIHRPSYEIIFQADVERAHAAIRLRGIQTDDQIDRTPYDLSPKRDALIARSIGKRVSRMSGIELAARLFQYLDKTYCEEHGCYHNVNRFAPPGRQSFAPRLPSHFLLQLAAKYPTGKRPYKKHCR